MSEDDTVLNMLTIEPHAAATRALAVWFAEETGIQVETEAVPYSEISQVAAEDARSGAGKFDVIQYWYPMLGWLVERGVLADISCWWEASAQELEIDDLVPVFRDTWCLSGGRRYGVPFDGDMHLLFYNTALFDEQGLVPPTTWDEYTDVARLISEAGKEGGIYGCGIMAVGVPIILIGTFLNRLASFGGGFFDDEGEPAINNPEAVAALEHLIAELPYAVPNAGAVGFDEMLGPWLGGRVGMAEFWADLGKMTDNPEASQIAGQWGVVPLPKGPEPLGRVVAPLNAGWSLGISTATRLGEQAQAFLGFCLRPGTSARICTIAGGLDPIRWSTYDDAEYREYATPALADAAKAAVQSAAVAWPTDARWPELQDVLNENLSQALAGDQTPRQVLYATQAAWCAIRQGRTT
jgi:multiple sugar transport system substrate-binding protein